jgi:anti-sigma28 factor (negative regulator of flagellin synthesis)
VVHLPDPSQDDAPEASAEKAGSAASVDAVEAGESEASTRRLESPATEPAPKDVPRPIGRERLRQLREAIRNGTYPTDADVMGGLARMFHEDASQKPADPKA